MKQLTETQTAALRKQAEQVMGNYPEIEVVDAINRIHFLTNFAYHRCIAGLELMIEHGMIAAERIRNLHRLPELKKVSVDAMPLLEALDLQITGISDAPTDDADESEEPSEQPKRPRLNLSHVNAQF